MTLKQYHYILVNKNYLNLSCNIGDYPYSNWYYEYGYFTCSNVVCGKIFSSITL